MCTHATIVQYLGFANFIVIAFKYGHHDFESSYDLSLAKIVMQGKCKDVHLAAIGSSILS